MVHCANTQAYAALGVNTSSAVCQLKVPNGQDSFKSNLPIECYSQESLDRHEAEHSPSFKQSVAT